MKDKISQFFLIISICVLIGVIVWLVYPSPYRTCHFVLTGMGRARLNPYVAKFKPYKGKTMGGAALMGAVVNEQLASYTANQEPYCFISLGAELSGTAEAFLTKGEAVAKAFDAMKLDAMLVGNIDFTFGKERLAEIAKTNHFKLVSSNVVEESSSKTPDYFTDELIIDSPYDLKIGLLGVTPIETPNLATKESVAGLSFQKPAEVLKKKVDSLRTKGADIVALMTQYNKEYITAEEWLAIASASPDICFMLDSDIEAPIPFAKDGVIIYTISSYNQTKEIDFLNLEITKKRPVEIVGFSSKRIATNLAEYDEDANIASVVDKATAGIRAFRDTVIGKFARDYTKSYYSECPIGDFVTDIMVKETGADVAFQNSGSIHNNISEGQFTNGDLYTVMPFANNIVVMDLKGSDILELLNISASRQRGVLQVSGIEYSYSYHSRKDYKLKSAKIKGEDIVPDKFYKVATNNFLKDGGDNYIPFTRGENVSVGRSQREAVREFIASQSALAPVELKVYGRIMVEE
jgi:2',3'-cyclic-nucleotide 2'-phosphodiesterase (5'-nucleotidase family)